jgi:Spy/CpxP family protein refolding chaperone
MIPRVRRVCLLLGAVAVLATPDGLPQEAHPHSYAGEEQREIKALSDGEVADYLAGRGMGLARPAELNHHPGPRHVLDLAGPLGLSGEQVAATRRIFDEMQQQAIRLGERLVAQERTLDRMFADGVADEPALREAVTEAARIQGELRFTHLRAHVAMRRLLTAEQTARYDELRGYLGTSGRVPSGSVSPHR